MIRVLNYACIHDQLYVHKWWNTQVRMYTFWSSFICTQMVEYSGMYMYICLHICAHNWYSALLYVWQWKRAQLYTTPDFSMDIQGCWAWRLAAVVVGKGDHICLWAAVIYFWSLLWCLQHSPGHCLS